MAEMQPPTKRQKTEAAAVKDPPPTSKVFTIVEVLEKVLSSLSATELARVERVSSLWKHLICTAPGLQEQRFLKAKPVTELLYYEEIPSNRTNIRIGLEYFQPRITLNPSTPIGTNIGGLEARALALSTLHPCLIKAEWFAHHASNFDGPHNGIRTEFKEMHTILSWTHGACWEDMYITQPPCKKGDLVMEVENFHHVKAPHSSSEGNDFATFGYVRDWLKKVDDLLSDVGWIQLDINNHIFENHQEVQLAKTLQASPSQVDEGSLS